MHARWIAWGILGLTCTGLPAQETALTPPLPSAIQEIEVIYTEGQAPKVSLKALAAPPPAQAYRLSGPRVDLLPRISAIRPFGPCQIRVDRGAPPLKLEMNTSRAGQGGALLTLQQEGRVLDALSYDILHLRGEVSRPITLALADEAALQREDNVLLTRIEGPFDLRIHLKLAAQRLDLRRLAALILLPEWQESQLALERVALEQTAKPPHQATGFGFWVWRYQVAVAQSEKVLAACQQAGCNRLLVQLPSLQDPASLWQGYARFLAASQARGIEAYALDGEPEAIYDPAPLMNKVRRLGTLLAEGSWAGLQLDLEPYLLEGFVANEATLLQYLAAIDQIQTVLPAKTRLSVVMPFWFTSLTVWGRPVAFAVADRADEIAIMSYRTDLGELRIIAEDMLRYGDLTGTPVWLSVETLSLPIERHLVLKSGPRRDRADAYLDRLAHRLVLASLPANIEAHDGFRVHHRVEVWPERLTFAGQCRLRVRSAINTILTTVPNVSLAGILIHDLDAFLALPD
jgi:hypothetical protein